MVYTLSYGHKDFLVWWRKMYSECVFAVFDEEAIWGKTAEIKLSTFVQVHLHAIKQYQIRLNKSTELIN